jgi:hypothetical protein
MMVYKLRITMESPFSVSRFKVPHLTLSFNDSKSVSVSDFLQLRIFSV